LAPLSRTACASLLAYPLLPPTTRS
jgi:hypothetical protein